MPVNPKNISYEIGALLYCPATNRSIVSSLIQEKFDSPFSLAFCLEDTIRDDCVQEAENILIESLTAIYEASLRQSFYLPKIFIRVRNTIQLRSLYSRFGEAASILTGFILPKFAPENAAPFIQAVMELNQTAASPLYMMPVLENHAMIDLRTRYDMLYSLRDELDKIKMYVPNIRVGGNDLCHAFHIRRNSTESIHKISPVSHIFSDILTVFGMDYIVSGPVWDYFNGPGWKEGLIQELKDDKLCGFIGKTVIHPKQISVVNEALKVSREDYASASFILNWNSDSPALVAADSQGTRMEEYNTHSSWAKKILSLAAVYGVRS